MIAVSSSCFQRKDGMWVARYIHDGKRKQIYSISQDEAIQKRQTLIDEINHAELSETCTTNDGRSNVERIHELSSAKPINNFCYINDNKQNLALHETYNNDKTVGTGNIADSPNATDMTLGEWLDEWLTTYIKPNKSEPTYRGYGVYVNRHIAPVLGSIKLKDLSARLFQDFFDSKARDGRFDGKVGGMSPRSLDNMRFMLKSAMDMAEKNNLIPYNFICKIKTYKSEKKEVRVLSPEEEEKLITVCRESNKQLTFGIVISLHLGLQIGELLALKWSDIDLNRKQISVRHSLSRCNDATTTDKKTSLGFVDSKASRTLNASILPDDFISHMETYMDKIKNSMGFLPETVIATQTGMPIDPGYFNRVFKQTLTTSGLKQANFDILKNTFVLRCLDKGVSFSELHKLMGCGESSKSLWKLKHIIDEQMIAQ